MQIKANSYGFVFFFDSDIADTFVVFPKVKFTQILQKNVVKYNY